MDGFPSLLSGMAGVDFKGTSYQEIVISWNNGKTPYAALDFALVLHSMMHYHKLS